MKPNILKKPEVSWCSPGGFSWSPSYVGWWQCSHRGSPVDQMVWPSQSSLLAWGRFQRTERWIAMLQPSSLNNVFNQNFLKNWATGKWASHCTSTCAQSPDSLNIYEIQTQKTVFAVRSPGDWIAILLLRILMWILSWVQDPGVDTGGCRI